MSIRNMNLWLASILLAVLGSLSGCGGGAASSGGGTPAASLNAAAVVGSWKMTSYTAPGSGAVDMTPYNLSLVVDASSYTFDSPVAIPGVRPPCAEYGTWSVSGNSLTTTPIAGSTCGNGVTTYTHASVSGSTMTNTDASGTYVYQRQTATPVTNAALMGTWRMMAVLIRPGAVQPLNQSNVKLDLFAAVYSLSGNGCSDAGLWSVSGSTLNIGVSAGSTCNNPSAYTETVSLNGPFMTFTDATGFNIFLRLPDAPASPVATGTNGGVNLSWQAVNGATSYKVYRATTSGALAAKTMIGSTATASYQDATAISGTTYYYQITGIGANGESLPSTEVSGASAAPPSPVTGLTATAGTGQVTLSWNAVSGATSYNVYTYSTGISMCSFFAKAPGTNYYSLNSAMISGTWALGGTVTTPGATHSGLTAGVCYQYMVTAVNAYGESVSTSYVNANPL